MGDETMIKLPPQVDRALELLGAAGYEAFVVGGAVRDLVRGGRPVQDWDLTTDALPDQIQAVFQGYRRIETGLKHGTVTVVLDEMPLEITTYRVDGGYSDHRHPDWVHFTRSLREDLERRDLWIWWADRPTCPAGSSAAWEIPRGDSGRTPCGSSGPCGSPPFLKCRLRARLRRPSTARSTCSGTSRRNGSKRS
jgi:hypothetical protein